MGTYQDYFLKITDIKGESKDSKHKGEIEVESYSFGVSNLGAMSSGGGGGAGKANFQDFHFVMKVSEASPELMLSCANGKHHKEAILVARKSGEEKLEYLKITMSDVLVSSYQAGGSDGAVLPVDQVSLNFSKIEFAYTVQDEKGKGTGTKTTSWNLKANDK